MRTVWLTAGWILAALFAASGWYLRWFMANAPQPVGEARYSLRANHVYLLLAALVHLGLGARAFPPATGARRRWRTLGFTLTLLAPAVLIAALFIEGPHPDPWRPLTTAGVAALTAGVGCVLLGVRQAPGPNG